MIRVRFKVNPYDYGPVNWPVKHPYWCTGYSGDNAIIVAYADSEEEILENWPDAEEIDIHEENTEYQFTDRFQKPEWFKG